jgi:hypothetical protein
MSTISELNYAVVMYTNDGKSKIARIPCNGLMPNPDEIVKRYWVNDTQTFYTHIGLDHENYSNKTKIQD